MSQNSMQIFFIEDCFDDGLLVQGVWENWIRYGQYQLQWNDRWMYDYSQYFEFVLARCPKDWLEMMKSVKCNVLGVMCDLKFDRFIWWEKDRWLWPLVEYCREESIPLQMMTGNISEYDQRLAEWLDFSIHDPATGGGKWRGAFHSLVFQILGWNDTQRKDFAIKALRLTPPFIG